MDNDGVGAQDAGAARDAVEPSVVEVSVRGEERGVEDRQRGQLGRAFEQGGMGRRKGVTTSPRRGQ